MSVTFLPSPFKYLKMYTMNKVLENIFLQNCIRHLVSTFSTNSLETSCGPPRQGQQVTMTTPLSVASLTASVRSVLKSGILPLPYVTRTTPSIGGSKHLLSEYKQIEDNRKDQKLGKHHLGLEGKSSVNFKPFTYSFFSLL